MSRCIRIGLLLTISLLSVTSMGCRNVPKNALRQSQLRAHQLYEQNRQLAMERNGMGMSQSQLAAEKDIDPQEYEHLQSLVRYAGVQLAVKRRRR